LKPRYDCRGGPILPARPGEAAGGLIEASAVFFDIQYLANAESLPAEAAKASLKLQ
jgi:hypothetical protein